jgi:alpha-beta hydrolase superfamily lysophospholipase
MKNMSGMRVTSIAVVGAIVRVLAIMLAGIIIALLAGGIFFLNLQPDLSVWHTTELEEEFTTESRVQYFREYLALEERLFAQLDQKVYAHIRPEEKHAINRYHKGSLADPDRWPTNWNRSFEIPGTRPVAGVLLLHGLSDSPYSLRHLGKKLSQSGAHVLGLRIPGHGTAPSGLVNVKWEDMAAAVVLSMRHLKETLGNRPLYIVGYSNGGALAVQYILSTLDNSSLPQITGVVLISPEIGVAKAAAFAVWQGRIGKLLGLPKLAWQSVEMEYDPFKYNSFAINAGDQAYRLTTEIQAQITQHTKSGLLSKLPPIMAFQSVVDDTVRPQVLIEGLFNRLPQGGHELVLFDINHLESGHALMDTSPRDRIIALLDKPTLPYRLTLVSNENRSSRKVVAIQKNAISDKTTVLPLSSAWPVGVYSLSHVAMPFAPDDPLYGGDEARESPGIQIGNVVLRGEKGVLHIDPASLLRMHWNPFYGYLEQRVVQFIQ